MNFLSFLEAQKSEDRQSLILHSPALGGKTTFVKQLQSNRNDVYYLDFLQQYLQNPNPPIHLLRPVDFQKYILSITIPDGISTVIIDHIDFILNTWNKSEKLKFVDWLRVNLRTPAVVQQTYVFVIQTDGVITNSELLNSTGQSRILSLRQLENLANNGRNK